MSKQTTTPRSTGLFGGWFKKNAAANTAEAKGATPSWYAGLQAYVQPPGTAMWSGRDYRKFAEEAYRRNVIANRAISMIARGVASIPVRCFELTGDGARQEVQQHPLCHLLHTPNPLQAKPAFMEALVSYYLLAGDAYVKVVGADASYPAELHLLRPDRVKVVAGRQGIPQGYRYTVDGRETVYPVDPITGTSQILHLRHFNPLCDWHGMAPAEAAAYSIDQHNQAAAWNQALLQNGARPSGALVLKMGDGGSGRLTDDQYWRLKQQVDEQFAGAQNAGRPLLLEGGLEWKEMSLNPRDMDFLNIKHSSARDIALAFGVPPQLLGIPGDNTYANLAEARLSLWEQTILPLSGLILGELQRWLNPMFGTDMTLEANIDRLPALAPKREAEWHRINEAEFLDADEKRALLGFDRR